MIARFVQDGKAIDYRPSEAVAAGDVVVQGTLIGIARLDIAANTLGSLAVVGVFDAPKAIGAITVGAAVYWDATNSGSPRPQRTTRISARRFSPPSPPMKVFAFLLNAPFTATVTGE